MSFSLPFSTHPLGIEHDFIDLATGLALVGFVDGHDLFNFFLVVLVGLGVKFENFL